MVDGELLHIMGILRWTDRTGEWRSDEIDQLEQPSNRASEPVKGPENLIAYGSEKSLKVKAM